MACMLAADGWFEPGGRGEVARPDLGGRDGGEGEWWGSKVMMAQRGGCEDDAALLVLSRA